VACGQSGQVSTGIDQQRWEVQWKESISELIKRVRVDESGAKEALFQLVAMLKK